MKNFLSGLCSFLVSAATRDIGKKILALVLTVIVYVFVSRDLDASRSTQKISDIPLKIRLPEKYDLLVKEPSKVTLSVLTHHADVNPADFKCREITVTPDMIQGNRLILTLTPSNFAAPLGCSIREVKPAKFELPVDRFVSKKLPVTVVFKGKTPKNYDVKTILEQDRPSVTVTALESQLKNLADIKTEPISLDSITQPFDYYAAVVPPQASEGKFQFAPPKVMVRIDVYRRIVSRTFRNIDVILLTGKRGSPLKAELVKDSAADVEVSGEKVPLNRLNRNQIKVFADVSMFDKPGVYQVDLSCWLTENDFSVDSITPKTVQVKVFQ